MNDRIVSNPKVFSGKPCIRGSRYPVDMILELMSAGMSKEDFTYQLSDHLPLWLVVNTDTVDEELDQILNPKD